MNLSPVNANVEALFPLESTALAREPNTTIRSHIATHYWQKTGFSRLQFRSIELEHGRSLEDGENGEWK